MNKINENSCKTLLAFSMAALTFLVYSSSLGNGFVNWDDHAYVYENVSIRSLDAEFLKNVFTRPFLANWHPLTTISFAFDFSIWGLNPFGYHLVNALIHSFNAALAFLLAMRLCRAASGDTALCLTAGAVTGVLFGLHPLRVESVAWVSERKDVLSAAFFLLSVLSYLNYRKKRTSAWYAASLLSFLLSLLCKPMTVTLPLVLLIIDLYPLNRFTDKGSLKSALLEKLPFFALSAAFSIVTVWAQSSAGAVQTLETLPLLNRCVVAVRAYGFYLYKMILPFGLAPYYPRPLEDRIFDLPFIASAAALAGISIFSALTFRRKKYFTAVLLYYIITLLPVAGIIQAGSQAAADRYAYSPAIGPLVLAGAGAGYLYSRAGRGLRAALLTAGLVLSLAFSFLTIRQIGVWKDSVSLWSREISLYPDLPLGYANRAVAYGEAGRLEEAIRDFGRLIELRPNEADAHYNRAVAFGKAGRHDEAVKGFAAAIRLKPDYAQAYVNRAAAYANMSLFAKATEDLRKAAELKPLEPSIHWNLGLIYLKTGEKDLAMESMRRAYGLGMKEAGDYLQK